jgi:glycosyltransferase involved in cell wall biosynthesis
MQWLHRNFQVIVIESANWRLAPGVHATWRQRLQSIAYERINRFFTDRVDLAIFTQQEYRESLRTRRLESAHVIEATWIDSNWVVNDDALRQREQALAARPSGMLRLMFAGRLTPAKGITWLVDVLAALGAEDRARVHLDIYGEGPAGAALQEAICQSGLQEQVRMCGSLAYGASFLAALSDHDALIVPSLSDEQPRVVYDAYSQGVPVIASATPGLAQCVQHEATGWLFPVSDAESLCRILRQLAADPSALACAGRNAVNAARQRTHSEMHRRRWQLLSDGLAAWQRSTVSASAAGN